MSKDKVQINRFKVDGSRCTLQSDYIAIEEPLQVSLVHRGSRHQFILTMRTPGQDKNLIYGLLFTEGVIAGSSDVIDLLERCGEGNSLGNEWEVTLRDEVQLNVERFGRQMISYSGCGLCGKSNLQALELKSNKEMKATKLMLNVSLVRKLKAALSEQPLFSQTGGVHVAGLIYEREEMLDIEHSLFYEDIGRHNALDKLIGHELLMNDLQRAGLLVLSGRIGYELIQKAVMAGFSTIVALGAPSSLAVEAAKQFGVMLVGFAKDCCFNLYTADRSRLIW